MLTLAQVREDLNDLPHVYPPSNVPTPELLGSADGVNTLFFLGYPNVVAGSLVLYIGLLQTIGTEQAMVWTAIPPAAYANVGQQIQFATFSSTSAGPITAGSSGLQTVLMTSTAGLYVGEALNFGGEPIVVAAVGPNSIGAVFSDPHGSGSTVTGTGAPAGGAQIGARYQATAMSDTLMTTLMANNQLRYGDDQTALKGCLNDYLDFLLTNRDLLRLVRYGDYSTDSRTLVMQIDKLKGAIQSELEGAPRAGKQIPGMVQMQSCSRMRRWSLNR